LLCHIPIGLLTLRGSATRGHWAGAPAVARCRIIAAALCRCLPAATAAHGSRTLCRLLLLLLQLLLFDLLLQLLQLAAQLQQLTQHMPHSRVCKI
jgi:hypothetical protein